MKTIKVRWKLSGTRMEVSAFIYGIWAAHRAVARPGWSVTHIPSGLKMETIEPLTECQARAVAKKLGKLFPLKTVPALRKQSAAIKAVASNTVRMAA